MIVVPSWEGQGHLKTLWTLCLGQTNHGARPETQGRRNSAGCCTAGVAGERLSCNSSAEWSPGTTSGPGESSWARPAPSASWVCPHLPPHLVSVSNGPRLGRMKGPIQRHYTLPMHMLWICTKRIVLYWKMVHLIHPNYYYTLLFKPLRDKKFQIIYEPKDK